MSVATSVSDDVKLAFEKEDPLHRAVTDVLKIALVGLYVCC